MFVFTTTRNQHVCEKCANMLRDLGWWIMVKRSDVTYCERCGEKLYDVRCTEEEK